jgi:hypothetical protein
VSSQQLARPADPSNIRIPVGSGESQVLAKRAPQDIAIKKLDGEALGGQQAAHQLANRRLSGTAHASQPDSASRTDHERLRLSLR